MPYIWLYGLCDVSAESETPGWNAHLSSDEASIAVTYAVLEMNGFASLISNLVTSHPKIVEAVIGGELNRQLQLGGEHNYLTMLQNLTHADAALQTLLTPRLLEALQAWPILITAESSSGWVNHLNNVLHVLGKATEADQQTAAEECARRYETDPNGALALTWLRGLFRFDPERGVRTLIPSLAAANDSATRIRGVETFAALFGDRDAIAFEISDPTRRARALAGLLRAAYAFIRHQDDNVHEGGVYTPNARDHAESARNFLLSTLLGTPGPEARQVILELAEDPNFAHFPDRLRLLARERAASDAEFSPFDAEAIIDLENRYEAPPDDRDGLFRVMMDRLDDLAHDISHHEFTDRRTLRTISDESEMQRTLALRISSKTKDAFVVTREDEVADRKRTDIRISAVRGDQKAVIEVKLADARWSLADLERALENQLVGQYLRHKTCKAGCLLLTYDGVRTFWIHPVTRKRLRLHEMTAYLNDKARAIEIDNLHDIRLAVFGLDLTDPELALTHRGSAPAKGPRSPVPRAVASKATSAR
jgi:hypothetical protein